MPLNEKKIIRIILEQCSRVPERANGYRAELVSTVADIIQAERQHRVHGTNIQQKVSDKCGALGTFLARQKGQLSAEGGA